MLSVEKSRDEYVGSVYGAAALAYITAINTVDALDALESNCPELIKGKLKYHVNNINGRPGDVGHLKRLYRSIGDMLKDDDGRSWMADFGVAANEAVSSHAERLRVALANELGRYDVCDRNAIAGLIVAQSLASEAAAYVKRRAYKLQDYTITMADGYRRTVSQLLNTVSCAPISHDLACILRLLLEHSLPEDTDLLADPVVMTGCKAMLNSMADVNTWIFAREKAEELNNKAIS